MFFIKSLSFIFFVFVVLKFLFFLYFFGLNLTKLSVYESGFSNLGVLNSFFSIHFFLVLVIFVLFDLEGVLILFFFLKLMGLFWLMFIFLSFIFFSLLVEWKNSKLNWEK